MSKEAIAHALGQRQEAALMDQLFEGEE